MNEQQEIQETLAEHRAWTWNRFKEQNGPHVIGIHQATGLSHIFRRDGNGCLTLICPNLYTPEDCYDYALACWPTCKQCANHIYNQCTTSLPEETSLESEVSGETGQLLLPDAETWGL